MLGMVLCACMMVYGSTEKAMVVLVKGYGSIGSVSSIGAYGLYQVHVCDRLVVYSVKGEL